MTFDFLSLVKKQYRTVPLEGDFIQPSKIEGKEQILWVGCSDSSVEETDVLDVPREEIFVHRNLGNIISNGDLSSESAIEWCLDLLKVKHIIVCGHYDCALIDKGDGSALGGWHKLHELNESHLSKSDSSLNYECRHRKLEEVYVLAEVDWLKRQPSVRRAMEEEGLKLHAFVYDKERNVGYRLVEEQ
ncbi:carbonic anhydrase [Mollisia scopiformis]|uniref:Carbonic anhydrase n=1 Tax=Mollisia scopiformis TaxID=149040 RepID=A0A132B2I1_MOLSC|nr:carbonic anhydrase [Mollisia scopiformis]KUJ06600.1 carbonic anhydrase [Mollisia scopiformis]